MDDDLYAEARAPLRVPLRLVSGPPCNAELTRRAPRTQTGVAAPPAAAGGAGAAGCAPSALALLSPPALRLALYRRLSRACRAPLRSAAKGDVASLQVRPARALHRRVSLAPAIAAPGPLPRSPVLVLQAP